MEKGKRKTGANLQAQLMLLAAFLFAVWMKAPLDLYLAFVVGVGGTSTAFMWGNRGEHLADALASRELKTQ